jgi:hypothetical protein
VAALGFPLALLIGSVIASPGRHCFDEPFHLKLVEEVERLGWIKALVSPDNESAVGPLYPALHAAAKPLTRLEAPAIRWINVLCLFGTVACLALWLQRSSLASPLWACQLFAVPFLWPAAGMALTELPALFAFTLFGFFTSLVLTLPQPRSWRAWLFAVCAGLALGVAVLGRQTYLVALPCIGLVAIRWPKHIGQLATVVVVAMMSCGWIFWIWNGLVPPSVAHVDSTLRPEHALFALMYLGVAALFVAPPRLLVHKWPILLSIVASSLLLSLLFLSDQPPPAKGFLTRLFGEVQADAIGLALRWLLLSAGVLWLVTTVHEAWCRRNEPAYIVVVLLLIALLAAPAKVSHMFSSRYVVGALGLLIVQVSQRNAPSWSEAVRAIAGSSIGCGLLWSYYNQAA